MVKGVLAGATRDAWSGMGGSGGPVSLEALPRRDWGLEGDEGYGELSELGTSSEAL